MPVTQITVWNSWSYYTTRNAGDTDHCLKLLYYTTRNADDTDHCLKLLCLLYHKKCQWHRSLSETPVPIILQEILVTQIIVWNSWSYYTTRNAGDTDHCLKLLCLLYYKKCRWHRSLSETPVPIILQEMLMTQIIVWNSCASYTKRNTSDTDHCLKLLCLLYYKKCQWHRSLSETPVPLILQEILVTQIIVWSSWAYYTTRNASDTDHCLTLLGLFYYKKYLWQRLLSEVPEPIILQEMLMTQISVWSSWAYYTIRNTSDTNQCMKLQGLLYYKKYQWHKSLSEAPGPIILQEMLVTHRSLSEAPVPILRQEMSVSHLSHYLATSNLVHVFTAMHYPLHTLKESSVSDVKCI